MLCDANVLIALINHKDDDHQRCRAALSRLSFPLLTTWPCVTEAMYLLHKYGGHLAQDALWKLIEDGKLDIHLNSVTEWQRMRTLMRLYANVPMDLADASLVAAAEALQQNRIFTLDSDFHIYRLQNGGAFEIVP